VCQGEFVSKFRASLTGAADAVAWSSFDPPYRLLSARLQMLLKKAHGRVGHEMPVRKYYSRTIPVLVK